MNSHDPWSETLSAVLISAAALLQAWTGYQASLWDSIMSERYQKASSARTEATLHANLAAQLFMLDAGTFIQLVTAQASGNRKLADFILKRVRPEAKPAVLAWLAQKPSINPDAPVTPFQMPEYRLEEGTRSQELFGEADRKDTEGDRANNTGDEFIRITVFLATVSFLGGICTRFRGRAARSALIGVAALILGISVMLMVGLPVTNPGM